MDDKLDQWLQATAARHLETLTFAEVSRALRALSSTYVERRTRIADGAAFGGAGKRAAFALFYGPLHYLLVQQIVRAIPGALTPNGLVVDLGCGTGAAGAAWAHARRETPRLLGIDRHPFAVDEASRTYRAFGVRAATRRANVAGLQLPKSPADFLAAFAFNELPGADRDRVLAQLVERARHGDRLLIVEPLARSAVPWWDTWQPRIESAGGRADEWRFRVELPALVAKLDRAAGLNHRELTGRSFWVARGPRSGA